MPPRRRALAEVDANATPAPTSTRSAKTSIPVKPRGKKRVSFSPPSDDLQIALKKREQENEDLKAQVAMLTEELSKAKIESAPAAAAPKKNPFGGEFLPATYRFKTAGFPPSRPTTAQQFFSTELRPEVRAAMPTASPFQVNAQLKVLWESKSDMEKTEYLDRAATDKARYEGEKADYDKKVKDVERTNLAMKAMHDDLKKEAAMELYEREMAKKVAAAASENAGPEKPKQARTAWIFYVKYRREQMKDSDEPTPTMRDLNVQMSEAWNRLQRSKKKADKGLLKMINGQADADRKRYEEEMIAYNAKVAEHKRKADQEAEALEKIALQKYAQKESEQAMVQEGKRAQAEKEKAVRAEKKLIREEKKAARVAKAALPKGARTAYQFFMIEQRSVIQAEQVGITHKEIMRELGARWKALSEEDKSPYVEKALQDRIRFENETSEAAQS